MIDLESQTIWREISATRSDPPGRAAENGRRALYSAALEQSEDLARAAAASEPSSRALPLFYSLAQGGRAIVAAWGEDYSTPLTHGVTAGEPTAQLAEWTVVPKSDGAIHRVSDAIASARYDKRVSIGALWRSLPDLVDIALPDFDGTGALRIEEVVPDVEFAALAGNRVDVIVHFGEGSLDGKDLADECSHYPALAQASFAGLQVEPPIWEQGRFGRGVLASWGAPTASVEDRRETLDYFAPEYRRPHERWVRPAVGNKDGAIVAPLVAWWVILFALSHITRYDPVRWRNELNVDQSRVAVRLAACLEIAARAVPHLVLNALHGRDVLIARR